MFKNTAELNEFLKGKVGMLSNDIKIMNANAFREAMDRLVKNSMLNEDAVVRDAVRWVIREGAQSQGAVAASIHDLYMARGRNEYRGVTVPAINVRGFSYDLARAVFRAAIDNYNTAVIFEIAKSEATYTFQPPAEFAPTIFAAAVREGYVGPVFIQGDHYQLNLKKFKENKEAAIDDIRKIIVESIAAGYYNIDIDSSTLVDLSRPTVIEQQRDNYEVCAELTKFIRKHEPAGVTISVGGEIGEVGEKNTTVEELEAYMDGYEKALGGDVVGLSKLSVQTGTTHGGIPLADGSVANVKIDFETLELLSTIAIDKYGLSGCVQHGASTLPDTAFNHFPRTKTSEIHLATGFQNILMESEDFPKDIKKKMYKWLDENCANERKDKMTDKQFYYKARKKAWGPFKKELSEMPEEIKAKLRKQLVAKLDFIFKQLNSVNTADLVKGKIKPVRIREQKPAGL
jgi:fructose/tagatose bisphosphate aldolase